MRVQRRKKNYLVMPLLMCLFFILGFQFVEFQSDAATTYVITFDANGGTGGPGKLVKTHGVSLDVPINAPKKSGYVFLGWGVSNSQGNPVYFMGDSISFNSSTTFYACYKSISEFNNMLIRSLSVNSTRYISFTPSTTGVYTFFTSSVSLSNINKSIDLCDTYGSLYKTSVSSSNLIAQFDDICNGSNKQAFTPAKVQMGWKNYNFSITYRLVAGTQYYLKINPGTAASSGPQSYSLYLKSYAGANNIGYFYGKNADDKISTFISSEQDCIIGLEKPHQGIDIARNTDYKIYSISNGKVIFIGDNPNTSAGYYIAIEYTSPSGSTEVVRYLHLKEPPSSSLYVGKTIAKGDLIGITGGSGGYPVHLHLDINTAGKHFNISQSELKNPLDYYTGTITYN